MAALTKDRNTPERSGKDFQFPVAAATRIFAGSLVVLDAGVAKPGAAMLAVGTNTPILPNAFLAVPCWQLNSWDRFSVPKPRALLVWAHGEPVYPSEGNMAEAVRDTQLRIEQSLNNLCNEIEQEFGSAPLHGQIKT